MAAIAVAQSILNSWVEYGPDKYSNPRPGVVRRITFYQVQLVLSTQGGATNNIPVSFIGNLQKALGSSSAVKSDNSAVIPTSPSADGTLLLMGGGSSNAPADYSGTFTCVVWGYELTSGSFTGATSGDQS